MCALEILYYTECVHLTTFLALSLSLVIDTGQINMRVQLTLTGLIGLAVSARADGNTNQFGLIRKATDPQVPSTYPIGVSKESFAKTAGQLFDINGTVSYFAGEHRTRRVLSIDTIVLSYLTQSGTNAWWLGHLTKNEDVDKAMQQIADVRLNLTLILNFMCSY